MRPVAPAISQATTSVSDDQSADRSMASRLIGWVRGQEAGHTEGGRDAGPPVPTRVLGKIVSALAGRPSPSILDLGPVVGPNVAFFGETLGCRLQLEDLYADVDRVSGDDAASSLSALVSERFAAIDGPFDAILCWDIFDYLDKPSAQLLGRELVARVRPGGLLAGVFQTQLDTSVSHTKYVILDVGHLQYRTFPARRPRQTVFQSRDIERLFPGLTVTDSVLMLNRTREVLLRKRVPPAEPRP